IDSVGGLTNQFDIELAKNEHEAAQLLISADLDISGVDVEVSDLINCDTQSELMAGEHVEINPIAYINVNMKAQKSNLEEPILIANNGWYPDPLLKNQTVALKPDELQPFLITIHTTQDTPAGDYTGNIIVKDRSNRGLTIPIRVRVWDFELPKVSRFKTASFLHWGMASKIWGDAFVDSSDHSRLKNVMLKMTALAFKNKLPPSFFFANGLNSRDWRGYNHTDVGYPTHDCPYTEVNGSLTDRSSDVSKCAFNEERTLELINYFLDKGANHFFVGLTGNVFKFKNTLVLRKMTVESYLKDYLKLITDNNLQEYAYLYGPDEPENFQHAADTYAYVKAILGDNIKYLQNTNKNNNHALEEVRKFSDIIDINLGFYEINDAEYFRSKYPDDFEEFWWNINIWPATHPNLFIQYPLADARILGPMSYKYKMHGFEYWQLIGDISNPEKAMANYHPLAPDELRVNWFVQEKSLDGTLMYPGNDFSIYSSMRFESIRDGFEDMEYLFMLEDLKPDHELLSVRTIFGLNEFEYDVEKILQYRREVALAILKEKYGPDYDPSSEGSARQ
ncbi:MAG: DUF4091 domain-containing protein, partial [Gammaproteobacteria bacterium]|nr:DUF4091 domain-containing protein [Gammaproteobacteria bacterium]